MNAWIECHKSTKLIDSRIQGGLWDDGFAFCSLNGIVAAGPVAICVAYWRNLGDFEAERLVKFIRRAARTLLNSDSIHSRDGSVIRIYVECRFDIFYFSPENRGSFKSFLVSHIYSDHIAIDFHRRIRAQRSYRSVPAPNGSRVANVIASVSQWQLFSNCAADDIRQKQLLNRTSSEKDEKSPHKVDGKFYCVIVLLKHNVNCIAFALNSTVDFSLSATSTHMVEALSWAMGTFINPLYSQYLQRMPFNWIWICDRHRRGSR